MWPIVTLYHTVMHYTLFIMKFEIYDREIEYHLILMLCTKRIKTEGKQYLLVSDKKSSELISTSRLFFEMPSRVVETELLR